MRRLLIALTLVAGLATACGGSADDQDSAGSIGSVSAAGSLGGAPDGPDTPSAAAESSITRLVVTSTVALQVKELRESYRRTGDAVRSLGGFVAEGRIASADTAGDEDESPATAFMRLRVPAEQHDALLAELRRSAERVIGEETATKEVTGEYVDLQSRLANLRRSETQYQELLGRAGSIEEVLDVTARLDEVRGEIEQVQGRLNLLGDQSDYATVSVTLSVPAGVASGSSGLASPLVVFVGATKASVTVAHALLNAAAVGLVALLWLGPVALVYFLLRRPVQRMIAASRARFS